MIRGRDEPCPACSRRLGDHTVDEWDDCLGVPSVDLGFEPTTEPTAVKWTLGDRDVVVCDHVIARALVATDPGSKIIVPLLHLEFLIGKPGAPPAPLGEVAIVGETDGLRKIGKLLRDTANGAANAAERQR